MSDLYVVRHGQASFLSDDYDQLSELGVRQAMALGERWLDMGVRPDRVLSGSLRRQRDTASAIARVFAERDVPWPDTHVHEGLNEYPAEEIVAGLAPEFRKDPTFRHLEEAWVAAESRADKYRTFHRMLHAILERWIAGEYDTDGLCSWPEFSNGVSEALNIVTTKNTKKQSVVMFTSGGVVGTIVRHVLDAPAQQALNIHWRVFNAGVTRLVFSPGRITLDGFNDVAHLDDPAQLTYR
jgi:broad specificity phosphatase PhoE